MKTTAERRAEWVKYADDQEDNVVGWTWGGMVKTLVADIEELEAKQITDEQIDLAWRYMDTEGIWSVLIKHVFMILGIMECPSTGCHNGYHTEGNDDGSQTCKVKCTACHGHGWLRNGQGDEDDG